MRLVRSHAAEWNLDTGRIDAVFDKGEFAAAYSGFEGRADTTGLGDWLRAREVERVVVVGIATDYCVRATALDSAAAGLRTTVLLGFTAAVGPAAVVSNRARRPAIHTSVVSTKTDGMPK